MRRLFFIIITTLILVTGGLTIYLYNQPTSEGPAALPNQNSSTNTLPGFPNLIKEGITTIVKNLPQATSTFYQVTDLTVMPKTTTIDIASTTILFFVDQKTGQVYSKEKYGQPQRLSTEVLTNTSDLQSLLLPKNQILLILTRTTPAGPNYFATTVTLKSTSTITWQPLPLTLGNLIVAPDYKQIAYTKVVGERLFLYTTLPDFTNEKVIWSSPYTDWQISYYNTNQFLIRSRSDSSQNTTVLIFNPLTQNSLPQPALTAGTIYAGTHNPFYFTTATEDNVLTSKIISPINSGLNASLTKPLFTDLCTESTKPNFVYCAVPESSVSAYPTPWYQGKETYRFAITVLNPTKRQNEPLYLPDSKINFNYLEGINVSHNNRTLYFVKNSTLWQYDLLP